MAPITSLSRIIGSSKVGTLSGILGTSQRIIAWHVRNYFPFCSNDPRAIADPEATEKGAFSLVGSGDSVAAVDQFGLAEKISYVRSDTYRTDKYRTGDGAMLEYLEGRCCRGPWRERSRFHQQSAKVDRGQRSPDLRTPSMIIGKKHILFLFSLWHVMVVSAQDGKPQAGGPADKKGFMFGLNVGYLLPNNESATFYDGTPKEPGFLDLNEYLGQWFIRDQVINTLGDRAANFRLSEYPQEYRYNNALAIGGHLRYQFNWTHAVVADMNFARLRSGGLFVIEYPNTTGFTQPIYENFEITGEEDRMNLSLGYQVALGAPSEFGLHLEFGPMLTSVNVRNNQFRIGDRTYSILRAQTVGPAPDQLINVPIPTVTSLGGYGQLGANLEFHNFTVDMALRVSLEKIALYKGQEARYRPSYLPFLRLIYRVSGSGS